MNFERAIFSIGLLSVTLFMADAVSAGERSFDVPRPTAPTSANRAETYAGNSFESKGDNGEGGVSITNDVSVSASTGGNSSNGENGQSGGLVTTGSAKADVRMKTEVNGETVLDIDEEYEGEVEIEKEFENASGTVKTKIKVEVDSNPQPTTNHQQQESKEKRIEEEVWFLSIWPFGGNDKEDDADEGSEEEKDEFEYKGREDRETGSTTSVSLSESVANNQGRLRGFIKRLWSRLFSFFDF